MPTRTSPLHIASSATARRKALPKSQRQYLVQPMPEYIEPQLCTLVDSAPGFGWVHEIKLDGYRIQARVEKGVCVLRSRKGLDWTHRFPEIAAACSKLPDCIVDGEICGLDTEGLPSFSGLQEALSSKKTGKLVYFVFDCMARGAGEDYRSWALEARKELLEGMLAKLNSNRVRYVEHMDIDPSDMFRSACEMKLEGIVSKKLKSKYASGRAGLWTKTKCRPRQELVIGGWEMNGGRFSSLLLGAYRGGKFAYVGTAGTGFNAKNLPPLIDQLRLLIIQKSPFEVDSPKRSSGRYFVKKKLVCEVAFETWTRSGKIRQASYKGLREDKDEKQVVVEEPKHGEQT